MIETIRELLARRPFSPFRVILSSGGSYDVRHPEIALVLKGGLYIGLPGNAGDVPESIPDRAVFCSALHLGGVESLVAS